MAELTINVSDYLSEQEIRKIAEEELRGAFRYQLRNEADVERVLTNLSHEYVFHAVCDYLKLNETEISERIIDGVSKALEPDTIKWQVFKRKDAWERDESPAVKLLNDVLRNCKPKLEEMVNKNIEEYPFTELHDEIADTIYYCIIRKLFGDKEDTQ